MKSITIGGDVDGTKQSMQKIYGGGVEWRDIIGYNFLPLS